MSALEHRFAAYTVDIEAIQPGTAQLRSLHAGYAHTLILDDAYLSAIAQGLRERSLDDLPNTEDVQRDAIIEWRTGLMVLARSTGVRLPATSRSPAGARSVPRPKEVDTGRASGRTIQLGKNGCGAASL